MENDPLYQEGLKHIGQGEWSEAVACFTQLQASYPDDPRVNQFLETARLRAAASAAPPAKPDRSAWLRRLSWLGVVVIIVGLGIGIYLAYQNFVVPAQAENARVARLDQLRRAADTQIASGAYTDAVGTYQTILAEAPDDPTAKAGLAHAQQLAQVSSLYAQAMQAVNNGDNATASKLLEQIAAIDPNYRDANSLLAQIKATSDLAQRFTDAAALDKAGKWTDAAQAFEQIRATDRNFKPQEVTGYLYNEYMQLADQQVKQASTTADIEVANGLYQKALSVKPLDSRADAARRTTAALQAGAVAYQTKDWDTLIQTLMPVYQQQADYFGGKVREWLYEAFLTTGDNFLAKSDPFSARDRFAQAVSLADGPDQKAEAQKRYDTANRLTTPTPTPKPSPTPLPAGYIAPSYTFHPTGTPNPYPFQLVNTTYLPNTFTGEGCRWSGIAGRFFDRKGAPLVLPTLGVRFTGPTQDPGAAAGSNLLIGESGWITQFDVVPKKIDGFIQVYYKDQPVSDLIPFQTHKSCYENMLIMDLQQIKPLP